MTTFNKVTPGSNPFPNPSDEGKVGLVELTDEDVENRIAEYEMENGLDAGSFLEMHHNDTLPVSFEAKALSSMANMIYGRRYPIDGDLSRLDIVSDATRNPANGNTSLVSGMIKIKEKKPNGRLLTKHVARELVSEAMAHIAAAEKMGEQGSLGAAEWEMRLGEAKAAVARAYVALLDD